MKKLLLTLGILVIVASTILAQAPQSFKYQAIARDVEGNVLSDQQISIRMNLLQGSNTGQVVYSEIHDFRTNQFGLINFEIGNGKMKIGDISAINWGLSQYFVQIEIDINGGSDYKNMGVSQLLSVPYALYAEKTSEAEDKKKLWRDNGTHIYNTNTANVGIGIKNPAEKLDVNGNVKANTVFAEAFSSNSPLLLQTDGTTRIYVDDATGNVGIATTTPAGILDIAGAYHFPGTDGSNGQVLQTNGSGALSWATVSGSSGHYVGELYGDGVVFWVNHTGNHGLICSLNDIHSGSGAQWYNGSYTTTGATSDFDGASNTTAIIVNQGAGTYAAQICANYSTANTSAGDWYLPSIDELNKIYNAKYEINKALNTNSFTRDSYWSSTEYTSNSAWKYKFYYGYSNRSSKDLFNGFGVRAVRAF